MEISKPTRGGEPQPSPAELAGRLVAFVPVREDAFKEEGKPDRPMIVADVVVFGNPGETFQYGATEGRMGGPARPVQRQATLPAWIEEAAWGQQELMRAMRSKIDANRGKAVIGRIVRGTEGTKGTPPWILEDPTDADLAMVSNYFAQVAGAKQAGTWVPQIPLIINAAPAGQPAQGYAPPPVQTPPPGVTYQQSGGAQPGIGQVPPAAQPIYAQPAQAPTTVVGQAPPAGIPAAVWAAMPPEAQAATLAAQAPAAPAFDLNTPVAGLEAAWPHMPEQARLVAWQSAQPRY